MNQCRHKHPTYYPWMRNKKLSQYAFHRTKSLFKMFHYLRCDFQVLQFHLEGNDLNKYNPDEFSKCLDYVDDLSIMKCRVNDAFMQSICSAINNREQPVGLECTINCCALKIYAMLKMLFNIVRLVLVELTSLFFYIAYQIDYLYPVYLILSLGKKPQT